VANASCARAFATVSTLVVWRAFIYIFESIPAAQHEDFIYRFKLTSPPLVHQTAVSTRRRAFVFSLAILLLLCVVGHRDSNKILVIHAQAHEVRYFMLSR